MKAKEGPNAGRVCPECGRRVYGLAKESIVDAMDSKIRKLVLLTTPDGTSRFWQVGAVSSPKKFAVNWSSRCKHDPAIFRSRQHAKLAIKEWWKRIHEYHQPAKPAPKRY